MKDKIKQAGHKNQVKLARSLGKTPATICNLLKNPPKWLVSYIEVCTDREVLKIENKELREALKTFKQYCNQK